MKVRIRRPDHDETALSPDEMRVAIRDNLRLPDTRPPGWCPEILRSWSIMTAMQHRRIAVERLRELNSTTSPARPEFKS